MNTRTDKATAPRLRLVGRDEPVQPRPGRAGEANPVARRQVARENHAAAVMPPHDARIAFAAEVSGAVEGGRAAILRPERRRALLSRAASIGLRPFDANLVIAIVQEAARRGEAPSISPPRPAAATANLEVLSTLLKPTRPETTKWGALRLAIIAAGIAVCILGGLIAAMGR